MDKVMGQIKNEKSITPLCFLAGGILFAALFAYLVCSASGFWFESIMDVMGLGEFYRTGCGLFVPDNSYYGYLGIAETDPIGQQMMIEDGIRDTLAFAFGSIGCLSVLAAVAISVAGKIRIDMTTRACAAMFLGMVSGLCFFLLFWGFYCDFDIIDGPYAVWAFVLFIVQATSIALAGKHLIGKSEKE